MTAVMLVGAVYKVDCMKQQYEGRISVTQGKGVGEPSCVSEIVSFAYLLSTHISFLSFPRCLL